MHQLFNFFYKNFQLLQNFRWDVSIPILYLKFLDKTTLDSNKKWKLRNRKHLIIEKYLKKKYEKFIEHDENKIEKIEKIEKNKGKNDENIWVCWWQGEENMPNIVKTCYRNIQKNSGNHRVILITINNYSEYINLPDPVLKWMNRKDFLPAFSSDILRIWLLYEYGGIWLDATLFITQPLPNFIFDMDFFSIKNEPIDNLSVTEYRWSGFFMYTKKNTLLFKNFKNLFTRYCASEKILIDYLVIDYLIDIVRKSSTYNTELFNKIPFTNPGLHRLRLMSEEEYNEDDFEKLLKENWIFKLTYKGNQKLKTPTGKETYYGYLIDSY